MLGDNRNWSEDARYWADNALSEGLAQTEEEAQRLGEEVIALAKGIMTGIVLALFVARSSI